MGRRAMAPARLRARVWAGVAIVALALVGVYAVFAPASEASPRAGPGFGDPVQGQRIYDRAGALTPTEIGDLETRAQTVTQAGAPTVVYLQARDASYDQTYHDAQDVMNAWNIESSNGARDGFVIFLNLQPGNLRHGQVALYAGAKHLNDGALSQAVLQGIYNNEMLPQLRQGALAPAIAAALDATARQLQAGAGGSSTSQGSGSSQGAPGTQPVSGAQSPSDTPQPSPVQSAAAYLSGWPFTLLTLLYLGALAFVYERISRRIPQVAVTPDLIRSTPPSDLPPAPVGALAQGRVSDAQMIGTLIDLARRGAISVAPAGTERVTLHLADPKRVRSATERALWNTLVAYAGPERTLTQEDMPLVRAHWDATRMALHTALVERGWFDAQTPARRRPLRWLAGAGVAGLGVSLLLALEAESGVALLGGAGFLIGAVAAVYATVRLRATTEEGERVAAQWRGYLEGVAATQFDAAHAGDFDIALPYIVAMGAEERFNAQLRLMSSLGYMPDWLRSARPDEEADARDQSPVWNRRGAAGSFYPYWYALHSTMYNTPPSSTPGAQSDGFTSFSGGGGFSDGGGAASGGGGAGGSF